MKIAMAIRHLHRAGLTEFICLKCVWLVILCCSTIAADEPIDFSRQIGPILEQHCVRCHSPGNNKGDVSLTTFDDLKSNDYVIAGDPDDSYLIELVTSQDGEPPAMPKEAKPLSDTEVELLRQWIGQGAKWPDDVVIKEKAKADASWWAYQPLNVARLSESSSTHTPDSESRATTIDDFILAKLAERQLKPSPRANRRTLIRRLSFDLHGLPPTPEAVEAFVEDDNPKAYEKLVDRMLESPHYGERFAQHWLDIAHYADTHGFERDKRRDNAWRYRDYVIRALNEDKPYDRFLQEQIAGDVLWPDNEQAVIATGFLAAGPWDFVGQVETKSPVLRRSARSLDLDDMATQVITATMAMTINCARCHDHKIDPISQREYYQLRAVFAGVKREERVVSDAALKQYEVQKQKLIARRNKLDFEKGRLEGEGLNLADIVGGGNGLGTGAYRNAIDPRNAKVQTRNFGNLGNVVTNRFSLSAFEFVDGVFIPDGDNGKAEIPVSSTGVTVTGLPKTSGKAWDMIRNGPVASQHSPELDGIDFTKDGHHLLGLHANAGITFDLAAMRRVTRLSESSSEPPDSESQAALRFTATLGYFGAVGNNFADAWVFVDGRKVAEFRKLRRADGLQKIDVELPASARFLTLVSTDGGNGYGMDQIGFGDPRVKLASPPTLTDESRNRLAKIKTQREQIEKDLETLGPPPRFYGVVAQKTVPEVRLLTRGNPESPSGDALRPAALSSLVMLDSGLGTLDTREGERRAALARWITHPDNPLVHRVIVNRMWQWHFGTGLVDTPSDFGYGGGRPSHPELLDWLAGELAKRNWSLKAMHRLIVTSETYKQRSSSQIRENSDKPGEERLSTRESSSTRAMAIDTDNRLLWRQNPRRIDAEAIRDSVLCVSGKLNSKRGGPGFEDFQYQDAYAPIYTYVTADEPTLWRRSIYRYIVRTTPDRFLTTLDCPDPANFTPKRLTTTTPLQSLALYNNDFILRQARYFAQRLEEEAGEDVSAQVKQAFALAFGRQPSAEEDRLAMDFVNKQGLFALCRSLLNSNEFLYVD